MLHALATHWQEYLIEACLLGTFMVSACVSVIIFEHPRSPAARAVRSAFLRRAIVGLLMGLTAVALIYSPFGARSGAHMNPATTLTFLVLGKVAPWDAFFYILAQSLGGFAGVMLASTLSRGAVRHRSVASVVTLPGPRGVGAAWIAEFGISFVMMTMVLTSASHAATASYTGLLAGLLVAAFITFEAPLSGMSMNPARTLASALHAHNFRALWVYVTAPTLAMLLAAAVHVAAFGQGSVYCAKLNHDGDGPCLFHCRVNERPGRHPHAPSGIQHASDPARARP